MGIVQRTLTRGVVSVDVARIGCVEGFKYDRSRFEVQGKCLAAYVEQLNLDRAAHFTSRLLLIPYGVN